MNQEVMDGKALSFDSFVSSIESVKSVLSELNSESTIAYQDFVGLVTFMEKNAPKAF
jgi:hypothetical protein